jgi:hypothetical protein
VFPLAIVVQMLRVARVDYPMILTDKLFATVLRDVAEFVVYIRDDATLVSASDDSRFVKCEL